MFYIIGEYSVKKKGITFRIGCYRSVGTRYLKRSYRTPIGYSRTF